MRTSASVSLGKQEPPKPGPGMEELAADAPVEADAARDVVDVRADMLAEIGHLVDEGDLHREEGVGGVFDELGGLERGDENRGLDQVEGAVEAAEHVAGTLGLGADDDPVGAHEIGDRIAFAQEFRVGGDLEPEVAAELPEHRLDLAAGADRHRGLGDDHRVVGQRARDLLDRLEDIREVRMPVAAPRRRADGDEDGLGALERGGEIGAEGEPSRRAHCRPPASRDRARRSGMPPSWSWARRAGSASTRATSTPNWAKQAPETRPT